MKIGILTFHNSRNYGAVLQAFGLKQTLEQFGHKVEVIDYRNSLIENRKHPFSLTSFKRNPVRYIQVFFSSYINYRRKVHNFASFGNKHLNVTKHRYSPEDINSSDYDLLIVGSDQVWNPILTDGPDPVYWGNYKPNKARIITYAASSGKIDLLENEKFKSVGDWLKRFNHISVREERLKDYVDFHSEKKASVVVDPTLLAGRPIFEQIASPRIIKQPYVLAYSVEGGMDKMLPVVKKASELYHAKIIRIGGNGLSTMFQDMRNGIKYKNVSVEEMLSLIKYAECIIAKSFHGTVLSMLFEKEFFSVKGNNMARVESILSKCSLLDRIVDSPDEVSVSHIDYSSVNPVLDNLREGSMTWLKMSLES